MLWRRTTDGCTLPSMGERGNPEPADASGSKDERWQVRVAQDDIRVMTFEQLEEAFFSGLIDADTSVLDDGATEWKTLRQIAGRDATDGAELAASEDSD